MTITNHKYGGVPSAISSPFNGDVPPAAAAEDPKNGLGVVQRRANASFVMLARNSDIDGAVRSIRALEDRFNRNYGYPYVFLNEVPFDDDFKRSVTVK